MAVCRTAGACVTLNPIPWPTGKNKLYYGDNLEVLQRYVKDESVDLVYLDPPFNSRQDYNVLFAEKDGSQSSSQIHAFEDTWEWNIDAQRAYEQIVEQGGRVADALRAFKTFLFNSDMMAYLAMMAPRLVELRRVLKETGSIYLHCDPTASHYLEDFDGRGLWGAVRSRTRSSGNELRRSDTRRAPRTGPVFMTSSSSTARSQTSHFVPSRSHHSAMNT